MTVVSPARTLLPRRGFTADTVVRLAGFAGLLDLIAIVMALTGNHMVIVVVCVALGLAPLLVAVWSVGTGRPFLGAIAAWAATVWTGFFFGPVGTFSGEKFVGSVLSFSMVLSAAAWALALRRSLRTRKKPRGAYIRLFVPLLGVLLVAILVGSVIAVFIT